jgi:hypothetical protein
MPTYKKSSVSSISWSSMLSNKISDKIDSMTSSNNDDSNSDNVGSSSRFARLNLRNNQNDEEKIRGLSVDQPAGVVSSSTLSSSLRRSRHQPMRDETWIMGGIGAFFGLFCIRILRVRKRRRRMRVK